MQYFYVLKIKTPQRKLLTCVKLINHWQESTCLEKAGKNKRKSDFTMVKSLALFHVQIKNAFRNTPPRLVRVLVGELTNDLVGL